MTRFKSQREVEEEEELERELADLKLKQEKQEPNSRSKFEAPKTTSIEGSKEDDVDWKTRYAELRRHEQQKEANYKAELAQVKRQLEGIQNGTIKPPKSQSEIQEWKDTYPEFAEVLETWIDKAVSEKTADLRRKNAQSEQEKALMRLKEKHPDCEAVFADKAFHDWMLDQSKTARETIYDSHDVKGAIFVLDKYKAEKGIKKSSGGATESDDDLSAARSVKVRGSTSINDDVSRDWEFSESQIERETSKDPKWWDANEDKIMSAHRRRKILLDLSGGAQ